MQLNNAQAERLVQDAIAGNPEAISEICRRIDEPQITTAVHSLFPKYRGDHWRKPDTALNRVRMKLTAKASLVTVQACQKMCQRVNEILKRLNVNSGALSQIQNQPQED